MNDTALLPGRRVARLALALLLAAGLSIGLAHAPGTSDVLWSLQWARNLDPSGPFAGYRSIALDYPPLCLFVMWLSLHIGAACGLSEQLSLTMPAVIFGLIGSAIVLVQERSLEPALLLFLIVSPFSLLLGYYDVIYLPFLLLALYAADRQRWGAAGAALALAALIKWQPVILAPVFVIGALRSMKSFRQTALTALPALLIVAAVAAAFGPVAVLTAFRRATWDASLSGQGPNVGWIVSYGLEALNIGGLRLGADGAVAVLQRGAGMPTVLTAMAVLRGLFYLFTIASIGIYALGRPTRRAFMMTALAAGLVQFTLNTGVHENHLFVPMAVAFVAWNLGMLDDFVFLATAALAIVDVLMFYGFGSGMGFSRVFGIDATVALATAELVLFALVFALQIWTCLDRTAAEPAP